MIKLKFSYSGLFQESNTFAVKRLVFLRCTCNGSHDGHFVLKDVKVEPNMLIHTLLFLPVH